MLTTRMVARASWLRQTFVIAIVYISLFDLAIAAHRLDNPDAMPMTANGWRPIISNHDRLKSYQTAEPNAQIFAPLPAKQQQQTHNHPKTPSQQSGGNGRPSQSNQNNYQTGTKAPYGGHSTSEVRPTTNKHESFSTVNLGKLLGNKDIILHGNHGGIRTHGGSGSHGIKSHGGLKLHSSTSHRHPVMGKLQAHMALAGKRHKPIQHLGAAATRDEVFLAPPSSIMGAFPYFHTGPSKGVPNVHHGSSSNKHYILPGALPTHIEFPNHFAFSSINDELIQQLMRDSNSHQSQYVLPKNQHPSEFNTNPFATFKHSDEFTRNLVPPPYKSLFETETKRPEASKPKHITETVVLTPPTVNEVQIIVGKQKNAESGNSRKQASDRERDRKNERDSLVVQLPSPHSTDTTFDILKKPKVSLEITKEKFNVFHNQVPSNYNPHPELQNFFSSEAQMTPSKNHYSGHTYEVTEGKYEEATHKPHYRQNPHKHYSNQGHNVQDIDLAFLPTPYRPDGVNPTVSTHEVSTLYSSFNNGNPYDFLPTRFPQYQDVKHQYTHKYNELSTQLSVPLQDSKRINYAQNEPTTISEYELPPLPTVSPSNYYYTINQDAETTQAPSSERPTKVPRTRPTTSTPSSTTTRTYQRQRNQNRRRRPTAKPVVEISTTQVPVLESHATTASYGATPTRDSSVSYSRPSRIRPTAPYKTTPAPDFEILTTSVHPTIDPTAPIITNNYQFYENQYEEELQQKHRVRPSGFVDDFEDTEYSRSKYQETEPTKYKEKSRQRLRIKQRPVKEKDVDTYHQVRTPNKPQHERVRPMPDEEGYDYMNYESTKEIEKTPASNQRYRTSETTTSGDNQYPPPQRYVKTTTLPPIEDEQNEVVTEEVQITKTSVSVQSVANSFPIPISEPPIIEANIEEIRTTKSPAYSDEDLYESTKEATVTNPTINVTTIRQTTPEPAQTTKLNRLRGTPNRYDSNRPRFSVKEYRQRLNQQLSSTTATSRTTQEAGSSRIRFPTRTRIPSQANDADTASRYTQTHSEDTRKFVPKESRYRSSTEATNLNADGTTTEKVNTFRPNRLRPNTGKYNNRYRSTTTESSNAGIVPPPKVIIKPNTVFSNLKRPPPVSLRTRIFNKHKMLNTTTTTENPMETTPFESTRTDNPDGAQTTIATPTTIKLEQWDLKGEGTNFGIEKLFEKNPVEKEIGDEKDLHDMINSTSFLQSQRVADLTSLSAGKDYNSPGMFKTVSPNSRRIPNYFTIATDDPILPIEAFFPQLNHKESNKFVH